MIYWSDTEVDQIATELAKLRLSDPSPGLRYLIDRAQQVLPEHRRRRLHGYAPAKPLIAKAKEKLAKLSLEPEVVEVPVIIAEPARPEELLPTIPTEQLVAHLLTRCTGYLDGFLQTLNKAPRAQEVNVPIPIPKEQRTIQPKKMKIAVIGLLADQQEAVRNRINGDADLVFIKNDNGKPARVPPSADAVIVQRHARHANFVGAIKSQGRDNVAFVSGGISAVVTKIHEFLARPIGQV